jgi:hypothetical protein
VIADRDRKRVRGVVRRRVLKQPEERAHHARDLLLASITAPRACPTANAVRAFCPK